MSTSHVWVGLYRYNNIIHDNVVTSIGTSSPSVLEDSIRQSHTNHSSNMNIKKS